MENNEQGAPQPEEEVEEATEEESEDESEVAELRRQLEERDTKISDLTGKLKRATKPKEEAPKEITPKETGEKSDLDYGQKAFLRSYDIKGADELELVKGFMSRTGDDLESVVEDDIFQAKLGKLREARAATEAVPKGPKRSGKQATDDVSYWQNKIANGQAQLNDIDDIGLRRKVLDARIKASQGSNFTSNAVLNG